ncbi:MAG: tetratricopeptide repeat protein, partial [Selenomonas sp.]|nr:tetratricopeptide repeat protein [Selenomonas sp.]
MRFFKMGRMLIVAILLAISLMFLSEQFSEQMAVVWAEVMPFTGAGVSVQGTHSGTGEIAKEGAKMSAIQAAQDQAGIYVSSLSVMKDSALSQDEIATIVSDVVRIDEKNIKYETSILGDSDVQVVKYRASVTVYIDTDSLKKNIDAWRQKEEEKRQFLVNAVEMKRKSIEELNRKVSDAENMIERGIDKAVIQKKLTEIECESLAIKKNKEGIELGRKDNLKEAIKCFNEAINIKPDYPGTYINRGYTYYRLKNYQQAISDYDNAIMFKPELAGLVATYNGRGNAYQKLGNIQQAIKDYNKAIELNPKYAPAYTNRGGACYIMGNTHQAIADHSKAIELNPKLVESYYNRGITYAKLGNIKQAISDYSKAVELNPKYADAYYNRGVAYDKLGNMKQAISDYSKAVELNPKDVDAYYNRGTIYAKMGHRQQAIKDFNKVIELDPKD